MAFQCKAKAFFILLLLAGHEANRIENSAALYNALSPTQAKSSDSEEKEWQKEWQKTNHKCKWTRQKGCKATEGCTSRYLPLDGIPPFSSEKCRLSDQHMLKNLPKYIPLQAQVLQVTTMKFSKKCQSRLRWVNPRCLRLAKQVFRAMKFQVKAQSSNFMKEMTSEQIEEQKALFDQSLENMNVGKDAQYVTMLKEKLQVNGEAIKRNPIGHVKATIVLLWMLLKGSPKERTLARKAIESMDEEVPDELIETEATPAGELELDANDLKEIVEEGGMEPTAEDIAESSRHLDEDELADESLEIDPASALIQQDAQAPVPVTVRVYIVIALLLLQVILWWAATMVWHTIMDIMGFLMGWALLALSGCFAYAWIIKKGLLSGTQEEEEYYSEMFKDGLIAAYRNETRTKGDKIRKCTEQVFLHPFKMIREGGKWVYRKAKPTFERLFNRTSK